MLKVVSSWKNILTFAEIYSSVFSEDREWAIDIVILLSEPVWFFFMYL